MSLFTLILLGLLIWFVVLPIARVIIYSRRMARQWREAAYGARHDFVRRPDPTPPRPHKRFGPEVGEYVAFEDLPPKPGRGPAATDAPADAGVEPQVSDAEWEDIK